MTKRAAWLAEKRVGDLVQIALDDGEVLEGVIKGWLDHRRQPCFRSEASFASIYTLNGAYRGTIVPVPTGAAPAHPTSPASAAASAATSRGQLHRTCVADAFADDEGAADRAILAGARGSRRRGARPGTGRERGQRARRLFLPMLQRLRQGALAH